MIENTLRETGAGFRHTQQGHVCETRRGFASCTLRTGFSQELRALLLRLGSTSYDHTFTSSFALSLALGRRRTTILGPVDSLEDKTSSLRHPMSTCGSLCVAVALLAKR